MDKTSLRIDTAKIGPFTFRIGAELAQLAPLLDRINDHYALFQDSPLSPKMDAEFSNNILISSIYGTNSIEGGELSEEAIGKILGMNPKQAKEEEIRRITNLKQAYDLSKQCVEQADWHLDKDFIFLIHRTVTTGLTSVDERNVPGELRNNPDNIKTQVGSGKYKPPQYWGDISTLLTSLCQWHARLKAEGVPALLRAPLVHLYFEWIHPFWDGNGRVGRILEASILQAAGYRYIPFALSRYYFNEIEHYFALFDFCRKLKKRKKNNPNQPFIFFYLEGILKTLKTLHKQCNDMTNVLLFKNYIQDLLETKVINPRQHTVVLNIIARSYRPEALKTENWYQALYKDVQERTRQRDLAKLRELSLIRQDEQGLLSASRFPTLKDKQA